MGRIADKNSKRQRGFAIIQENDDVERADVITMLMRTLDISDAYAKTLFENFRRDKIKEGKFAVIYNIRDVKNGYSVDPYVSQKKIPKTDISDLSLTTIEKAVNAYHQDLIKRTNKSNELIKSEN